MVCWLLNVPAHAGVSLGRICSDSFTCCHTEIEVADQTFHPTQSQYTDTGPTSRGTDPITPGAWHGSHWSVNFPVTSINEEAKARIGNAIGPYEDLLTTAKKRKLKWYGHVTRSSGLAKTILQGTVQGGRRKGRQRKRWEDNIKEGTGLEWNIMLRKAENREEWSKVVVKSTVVPQRSARLRDR